MSGNPNLESSHNNVGSFQIDGPGAGEDLSYWVSRALGYATLCAGLVFGLGSFFIF